MYTKIMIYTFYNCNDIEKPNNYCNFYFVSNYKTTYY